MNVFSGPGKETGKGRKYCRERRESSDRAGPGAARGRGCR